MNGLRLKLVNENTHHLASLLILENTNFKFNEINFL
jgi:hypothetical protein